MTSSILAFNEHLSIAGRWATRTASTASSIDSGVTTGTLPITNIFTPNPAQVWQRTGISGSDTVTLDIELVDATSPIPLLRNAGAVWGFLNCTATRESTGELVDLSISVRESTVGFSGPYEIDKTHRVYLNEFQDAALRQTWFLRTGAVGGSFDWNGNEWRSNGGLGTVRYVRVTFANPLGLGPWTLRVGRIVRMSGLVCDIEPTTRRAGLDSSEIVRAFSGFPYVMPASRLRRYSGQVIGLSDLQIDGKFFQEDLTTWFRPSFNTIARVTGRSGEVCVIERAALPDTSSRWQQQPVFGYFESDASASRVASTSGNEGLTNVAFDIVESPQS